MSDPLNPPEDAPEFGANPEEIQRQIDKARLDMGATVDELVDRMRPANQAKAAKEKAMDAASSAKQTFDEALAGDGESQKKLGLAAAAVAGVAFLAFLRHRRK